MNTCMTYAKILNEARIKLGITFKEIAKLLNISYHHYYQIEKYNTTVTQELNSKICQLLELNPNMMMELNAENLSLYEQTKPPIQIKPNIVIKQFKQTKNIEEELWKK